MIPYLIAGAIGFVVGKLLEEDEAPKYADGGLIAPNGKPSNLTPEQYKLVRTPAFKKWFGDWENDPENSSKVVDENGEPLPVYHGTFREFNVFEWSKDGGFYFTEFSRIAEIYARSVQEGKLTKTPNENPIVLKCFLNFKNPLRERVYGIVGKNKRLINIAIKKGYDSLIISGGQDVGGYYDQYVAFEPEQIKLADGTNTTFDGNNPDIRYKTGGEIKDLVEDVSTEFLNSIRNQDKSLWNYDLEKSIEKQGILEPVTIGYWSEYDKITLIDGHHRLDTAIDLDIKSIPTIIELYYNNPIGKHRLYQAPKYNPNAKKPSDLGIFKKGGRTL